ncbi:MAG: SsrA-binding protein SmpB [Planctomycetota bacterium]
MARKSARRRKSKKAQEPSDDGRRIIASNRRARHDYVLFAKLEAGLALLGSEVKSLRANGATIREGYARVEGGELWLHGIHIPPLPQASYQNHDPDRKRKCLVHRREIRKLEDALSADGTTLIPLALYFQGARAKVELAVARGRRKGDRRAREREKEDRKRIRDYPR